RRLVRHLEDDGGRSRIAAAVAGLEDAQPAAADAGDDPSALPDRRPERGDVAETRFVLEERPGDVRIRDYRDQTQPTHVDALEGRAFRTGRSGDRRSKGIPRRARHPGCDQARPGRTRWVAPSSVRSAIPVAPAIDRSLRAGEEAKR